MELNTTFYFYCHNFSSFISAVLYTHPRCVTFFSFPFNFYLEYMWMLRYVFQFFSFSFHMYTNLYVIVDWSEDEICNICEIWGCRNKRNHFSFLLPKKKSMKKFYFVLSWGSLKNFNFTAIKFSWFLSFKDISFSQQ